MQYHTNNDKNGSGQEPEREQPTGLKMMRSFLWLVVGVIVFTWIWNLFSGNGGAPQLEYSRFREQLRAGNISEVTIQGNQVDGELIEPVDVELANGEVVSSSNFVTYIPSFGDDELLPLLEEHEVTVQTEPDEEISGWLLILLNGLPFLLLVGLGYLFYTRMRSQGQGLFSVGKSQAKLYEQNGERVTFSDVAGVEGAKTELREIIAYLKNPRNVSRLGGTAPKGVLLVGPPGTGKTLLARAVAGEARVPFFNITGSNFMEMFVGVGASRVRDLFNEARKAAPCIIFIDELDSVGRRRGAGLGGGHDEREQTLNQLLSEMDGFEPSENIIVMAATNRPDILDPALLRPGRFDRRITVDLPTLKSRKQILEIHARNKPLADDVDLMRLARGTPGFSGADLENVLNEAALLAARQNKDAIDSADIEDARDKILMGLEREGLALTDQECELIAYHEAGHAVVAALLPNADPIHKVTIVPRGQAMGVTQQLPEKEKYIYPREYLVDRMAVSMGGRAAEDLVFNTATSGAENDLKQATQLARKMVLDWGMSERLGYVALGGEDKQVFLGGELSHGREYSETTAREVDEEVRAVVGAAYNLAMDTLQQSRDKLDLIAQTLLKKEEISGDEILQLLGVTPPEGENREELPEDQADRERIQIGTI